jgi:hypothetical protein
MQLRLEAIICRLFLQSSIDEAASRVNPSRLYLTLPHGPSGHEAEDDRQRRCKLMAGQAQCGEIQAP